MNRHAIVITVLAALLHSQASSQGAAPAPVLGDSRTSRDLLAKPSDLGVRYAPVDSSESRRALRMALDGKDPGMGTGGSGGGIGGRRSMSLEALDGKDPGVGTGGSGGGIGGRRGRTLEVNLDGTMGKDPGSGGGGSGGGSGGSGGGSGGRVIGPQSADPGSGGGGSGGGSGGRR